jgi:hypothetical protein
MSWAFIKTMKEFPGQSYVEILRRTRALLSQKYAQIPQLSVLMPCILSSWFCLIYLHQVGAQFDLNQPIAF